jgi:hypothetical protein
MTLGGLYDPPGSWKVFAIQKVFGGLCGRRGSWKVVERSKAKKIGEFSE